MKIAIDIDGTIYDTEKYFRVDAELYDIDVLKRNSLANSKALWADHRYNWSEEENRDFINRLYEITDKSNLIPGAKEVIEKIQGMGMETIIITARGSVGFDNFEEMMDVVNKKLEKDNLKFDKIFWKNLDKVDTCINEKVDFIIDDSPEVCKKTSEAGINTIFLHDAGIQELTPNEHLTEVSNWGEVYRIISDVSRKM